MYFKVSFTNDVSSDYRVDFVFENSLRYSITFDSTAINHFTIADLIEMMYD